MRTLRPPGGETVRLEKGACGCVVSWIIGMYDWEDLVSVERARELRCRAPHTRTDVCPHPQACPQKNALEATP